MNEWMKWMNEWINERKIITWMNEIMNEWMNEWMTWIKWMNDMNEMTWMNDMKWNGMSWYEIMLCCVVYGTSILCHRIGGPS